MTEQRAGFRSVGYEKLIFGLLAAVAFGLTILGGTVHAQDASWPDTVMIGTAAKGGTYDAYGRGLTQVLRDKARISAGVRETNGPEDNLALLASGDIQIGFTTLGAALDMLKQKPGGADAKHIRALAPMYETAFHFVVMDHLPARTMQDLDGKSIGVGPHGGTTAVYVPLMLKALGINAKFVEGEWLALGDKLAGNEIEVLAVAGGTPFPALLDLGDREKLRFIPLSRNDLLKIQLAIPEVASTKIPAGLYSQMQGAYTTVGLFNFIVVRDDMPDSMVTAILDALFDGSDTMMGFTSAAAESVPSNYARNTVLPFHPSAARWYQRSLSSTDHGD
jgi:TRAP transporter TAXI family solute receptor